LKKDGGRSEGEGRAMIDTFFYLLIMMTTFGVCYAIYGLAVAVVRLIRCRQGCRPSSPDGA